MSTIFQAEEEAGSAQEKERARWENKNEFAFRGANRKFCRKIKIKETAATAVTAVTAATATAKENPNKLEH